MVLIICLVTEMVDWKQKLENQWVQIEISRVQPGKADNFLRLGSFSLPIQQCENYWEGSRKAGEAEVRGKLTST